MNEQERKRQRIYALLNAETKPKILCLPYTKQRKIFTEEEILRKVEWRSEQKRKRRFFFNCSQFGDLEGPQNVNKKVHK